MSNMMDEAIVMVKGLQMMAEQMMAGMMMAGMRMSDGEDKAFAKAGIGNGELWQGIKSK
jgi:hypothetical protein